MLSRPPPSARLALACAAGLALSGCTVVDSWPVGAGADRFPRVEGRWSVRASPLSSSCGPVSDEPFTVQVFQNRDILQLVVEVSGFGAVRWDGRLDRDGDFLVSHSTVFPRDAIRDESTLDGRFGFSGRTMSATEKERIVDLETGRSCRIVWRWRGDRR